MGDRAEPATGYEQPRVDPGAMALATVAGAVAFIFADGDWDLLAVIIGLLLLTILLGHHRAAPPGRTPRTFLLRAAFGATTGLALCIAIAPAIEHLIVTPFFHDEDEYGVSDDAWNTTIVISLLWFVVAALLAVLEPRIARWLDRAPRERDPRPSG
ncbi:MAG: hypothetical protein SW019_00590 [Actinomycetota bacterium]|nr:hypothetical protein [Actinomycetota bacterium]